MEDEFPLTGPVVPPSLARRIVLRHLPRILRAGLDPDGLYGRVPVMLARDAGAVDAGLGEAVLAWIAQGPARDIHDDLPEMAAGTAPRGPRALLRRVLRLRSDGREERPSEVHPSEARTLVGLLDGFAAAHDSVTVREIADAVLVLTASPADRSAAARLAASMWRELPRIDESAAILRLLDMAEEFDDDDDSFVSAEAGRHGLLPLPMPEDARAEVLRRAWVEAIDAAIADLRVQARALALGLSALAVGETECYYGTEGIGSAALRFGEAALGPVERRARAAERRRAELAAARKTAEMPGSAAPAPADEPDAGVPEGHVLVCPAIGATGSGKGRDVTKGYEKSIAKPLPLVPTPDLVRVRRRLLYEFPQAGGAVDFVLCDLVGKPFVRLGHLLIVGPPGSGKSRFVRRLGEELGTGVFRVDGSNDAGASFGGTERRWYSAEPARPFMAVNRFLQANPLVLVDEVDKAPTRSDYGRLWDGMISFLEPETAARFPDPCVQAELDLSWVSVVATANVDWNLPAPLLDRLRRIEFPHPGPEHLEALLPALLAQAAAERGTDPRWVQGLTGEEVRVLRRAWRGGSVRRLRRMLDVLLRHREQAAVRH